MFITRVLSWKAPAHDGRSRENDLVDKADAAEGGFFKTLFATMDILEFLR